ncbi:UNVERIFIED_CONTAM: hypothetical protein FKN15_025357 [Acipenser sinensis]
MGRKSCKKQQKQQQLQQQSKRWWSRVPTQFRPPDWATEQEQWRAEGAPMCDACGEFGHDREDCPYGNQGLVCDAAEWFWSGDQTQLSSKPKSEEPERPPPKPAPAGEECLLIPPPSPEEISWEALLRTVKASCWCPICGVRGHSLLNCPLLPKGCLLLPFPLAEGECLLVPSPPPPMAGAEQQVLPLPPSLPPEGEEQELPLPSPLEGPGQDAGGPQQTLHMLQSRAQGKTARPQRPLRGSTPAPQLLIPSPGDNVNNDYVLT